MPNAPLHLHHCALEGYGQGAQTYARGRPGFPPGALEWLRRDLRLAPDKLALEIGAGTGKFTSLLTQTGADVVAVEPVAAMLAQTRGGATTSADAAGRRAGPAHRQRLGGRGDLRAGLSLVRLG
jgi:SAM-dependent methyltransferase